MNAQRVEEASRELEQLVVDYTVINEQIAALKDQQEEIKARIRELAPVDEGTPARHVETASGLTVSVTASRRLSPELVARRWPSWQFPKLWRAEPNAKVVREQAELDGQTYDDLMVVVGDPRVSIR